MRTSVDSQRIVKDEISFGVKNNQTDLVLKGVFNFLLKCLKLETFHSLQYFSFASLPAQWQITIIQKGNLIANNFKNLLRNF